MEEETQKMGEISDMERGNCGKGDKEYRGNWYRETWAERTGSMWEREQ